MVQRTLNPYKDPKLFFNRKTLIETLLNSLFSGPAQCQSIVGPSKIGKTSLIDHLSLSTTLKEFGYEGDNYLFVCINCNQYRKALKSTEDFYQLLLHRPLTQHVTTIRDFVGGQSVNPNNPFAWQEEWERVLQELADNHFYIILILDDFDRAIMQENLLRDGLFDTLRSYGSTFSNFAWITCTLRPLHILFNEAFDEFEISKAKRMSFSEFYNIAPGSRAVGLFDQEDIEMLIKEPLKNQTITFSPKERQAILRFGGRFPYFIQRACYHFFEAQLKGMCKHEEVLQECTREVEIIWVNYWNRLTIQQQRLLFSIASDHPVESSTDIEHLKDASLVYEENGRMHSFSEEFSHFIRTREHSHMGFSVNRGDRLWNKYEVEDIAGRTLHSQVVKARHIYLKRHFAIKLLCVNQDLGDQQVKKIQDNLLREVDLLAPLEHKNIGKIYDIGLDPLGVVMPWIEGKTLHTLMKEKLPLSPALVIKIGIQLADALCYAHAQGIIHRDIKPYNIILTLSNESILIDFDAARSKKHDTISIDEYGSPISLGTVEYWAPEQFENPNDVGPPIDLFALGLVLYELVTDPHQQPYPYGNSPKAYRGQLPTPKQYSIPDPLFRILCALLHQEPEQRPNANELYKKLQSCLAFLPEKYE